MSDESSGCRRHRHAGRAGCARLRADGYQVRIFTRKPGQGPGRNSAPSMRWSPATSKISPRCWRRCRAARRSTSTWMAAWTPTWSAVGRDTHRGRGQEGHPPHHLAFRGLRLRQENCWYAGTKAKFEAEAAVRASGVPYTIFQATFFMETLPRFVRGTRQHPRQPTASLALGRRQRLRPHGLQSLRDTGGGQQDAACFRAATLDDAPGAANLLQHRPPGRQGRRDPLLDGVADRRPIPRQGTCEAVLPFFRYSEKVAEAGDPAEANALLGAPTTHAGAMVQAAGGTEVDQCEHAAGLALCGRPYARCRRKQAVAVGWMPVS